MTKRFIRVPDDFVFGSYGRDLLYINIDSVESVELRHDVMQRARVAIIRRKLDNLFTKWTDEAEAIDIFRRLMNEIEPSMPDESWPAPTIVDESLPEVADERVDVMVSVADDALGVVQRAPSDAPDQWWGLTRSAEGGRWVVTARCASASQAMSDVNAAIGILSWDGCAPATFIGTKKGMP